MLTVYSTPTVTVEPVVAIPACAFNVVYVHGAATEHVPVLAPLSTYPSNVAEPVPPNVASPESAKVPFTLLPVLVSVNVSTTIMPGVTFWLLGAVTVMAGAFCTVTVTVFELVLTPVPPASFQLAVAVL